ncbi:MAG: hypothetical protein QGG36_02690 [Pirellulaceae bacterium]|jgi:hypothetical protein|nr:hypothetical protein [Pirellulaceae bacterium]
MRFWTALQFPLCQAALVEDGEIVRTIPCKPPGTPARRVVLVGDYEGMLVVGRRNSIEIWDREGGELIQSVYHPWIYSFHACLQHGQRLLVASATLDVVFSLDLEGEATWAWWAHRDGLAAAPSFVDSKDWASRQLTQEIDHNTAHLNSLRWKSDKVLLATLLRRGAVVAIDIGNGKQPVARIERELADPDIHDFQYVGDRAVYGTRDAIVVGDCVHTGFSYVKRVVALESDQVLFSHENGVTALDGDGARGIDWTLPRPFGFACLET